MIEIDMDVLHSWVGDLTIFLTAPDDTSHTIFSRVGVSGAGTGDSSNLVGIYNFTDDESANNLWDAAAIGGSADIIPPGDYRTSENGSAVVTQITSSFQSLKALNGIWTLTVNDHAEGNVGSITTANLFIMTHSDIIFKHGFD